MTTKKGVSLNWVVDTAANTCILSDADVVAMKKAGVQIARVDLRLGQNQSWSQPVQAAYDTAVGKLIMQGIEVLGLLGPGIALGATQAAWNDGNQENGGFGWNNFLHKYAQAVLTVVGIFPQISLWEIWNEPNSWTNHTGSVYTGGSFIYPSLYAAVLEDVYPKMKSRQPQGTVITGGLLAHDNQGVLSLQNSGADYLDDVYNTVSTPPFDAVGMHYYIDQGGSLVPEHLQRYLNMLLSVIAWYERIPNRPVYVTEIGWTTKAVSEGAQASNLVEAYDTLGLNNYVQAVLNFEIRDNPPGNQYYGLLHADGTPKTAFDAFHAISS